MHGKSAFVAIVFFSGCAAAIAQQTTQVQLKIEPTNRTLTVSAEERVTADPDLAILHVGFETQFSDAKSAYAAGAKISNDIIAKLKQAGIQESAIHSESQKLISYDSKARKYKLVQDWTVKTPPERAAEILDIVVTAGGTDSGEIEWTVNDEKALEQQALAKAAARATADAAVLATSMGVRLGQMIYVNNGVSRLIGIATENRNFAALASLGLGVSSAVNDKSAAKDQPLVIEPHKVSRTASVYAVFSIE
jgi:uncharacterized protein YggE